MLLQLCVTPFYIFMSKDLWNVCVAMRITICLYVTSCSLLDTNVATKPVVSIIMVEDVSSIFLRKVSV
jgi:hypothetical protein